jgi:hypothetical protein
VRNYPACNIKGRAPTATWRFIERPRIRVRSHQMLFRTTCARHDAYLQLPRRQGIESVDRKAQRPENITPVCVYPENVTFEWPAVSGPDSGGVSWTHPWKSKMAIIAHAVTIKRHILTLMNPLYAEANTSYSFQVILWTTSLPPESRPLPPWRLGT